jgi:uncharacterized membrane protein
MMIIYHLAYDLNSWGYFQANILMGPWLIFAQVTASLFILLVGVSLTIGHARASHQASGWDLYKNHLARGLKLMGWGMVISLVTWAFMGQFVVIFGILHFIGVAVILAYPFLSFRVANARGYGAYYLGTSAVLIVLGIYLNRLPVTYPWLLWLGLRPPLLYQGDYFPVLPWFGVVLLGIFVGQLLYPDGMRQFDLPGLGGRPGVKELAWLGRHSLLIYLVHQPFLFAILNLISVVGW